MVAIKKDAEILNFDKAMKEVNKIKDLATNQLVNHAVVIALKHLKEIGVNADFDFELFVGIMKEFSSNQELLKQILSGKELSWENDDTLVSECEIEATLGKEDAEDLRTKNKVAAIQIFLNDDEQDQKETFESLKKAFNEDLASNLLVKR